MINFLVKISNWKYILPFFLLTAYLLFTFINGQNEMSAIAGEEVTLIDLWQSYNFEEITTYFKQLKPEGRAIHEQLTSVQDMIFPFAYGPFFILVFAFFLKNIFGKESKWILLSLFPMLIMGMDYLENINTLEMLRSFPNHTEEMVSKGSFFTEMKNWASLITNILFVLLSIIFSLKVLKKKKK